MKKWVLGSLGVVIVTAIVISIYYLKEPSQIELKTNFAIADFDDGEYSVGSITNYVKNLDEKFDPWGARYGGVDYRALLQEIDASGEPRTIVTEIWYPAASTQGFPQATYGDYFENDDRLIESIVGFAGEGMSDEEIKSLAGGLTTLKRNSYVGAPVANGIFPLVVFVHGLGGKRIDWNDAAQRLASRGYVVVAMTMPSDGTLPPVFNDPNSRFAAVSDSDAIAAAYDVMGNDTKVFPRFLEYLYGLDVRDLSPATFPDLSEAEAPPGGADKMTEMMARLFQQRVDDVAAIVEDLRVLASNRDQCEEHFASQALEGKKCGLLDGRIDFNNIGMSGHSLGSISTQVALRQIPHIKTGLGFNNGIPKRWEPLSHGVAPPGTLSSIDKPFAQVHGTEDDFVFFVFQLLFGDWYEGAGGNREEIFLLQEELAPRTLEHSQPVVFAAYERASGPKFVASLIDGNHDAMSSPTLTTFLRSQGVEPPLTARRLPDNDGLLGKLPGPKFRLLEYATDSAGVEFRVPTFIGNYYLSAWFDWQLKGDQSAIDRIKNPPFSDYVETRHDGF